MKSKIFSISVFFGLFLISLAFAQPRVISVLYFENTTDNKEYAWLSKGLADMLITDMAGVPELTVVEREDLQKIVKEQERSLTDLFDEQSAVRIGMLLAAKQIVIGSFIIQAPTLRVDVKIVDVESGKVQKAVQNSGDLKLLFQLQKAIAVAVLKELGFAPPDSLGQGTSESLDAVKAYYTGIGFLDEGAFEKAAAEFRSAIAYDPYYLKPQKSLEEAYKFLKDFKKQRYQREIAALYEKAVQIKARLASPTWMTYGEFLTECYKKGLSQEEIKRLTDANPTLLQCDSRAHCTWELQHTLLEIADKAEEYFEDLETVERMHREIMFITDQARVQLKDDPFFPEIVYMELFSLQYFEEWERLMQVCEFLMTNYPDYRMMWAVEGFYERALEKQGVEIEDD